MGRRVSLLVTVLGSLALATAACSSGAASSSTTVRGQSTNASSAVGGAAGGDGGGTTSTIGGTGADTAQGAGGTGTSDGSSAGKIAHAKKAKTGTTSAPGADTKGSTPGIRVQATTPTTSPSSPQHFTADAATFDSALTKAENALGKLPSGATASQASRATKPLTAAAVTFQSQVVNLQWPSSVIELTQSLTEYVGQLATVVSEAQRPATFQSIGSFSAAFTSAAAAVRSASNAVNSAIGS